MVESGGVNKIEFPLGSTDDFLSELMNCFHVKDFLKIYCVNTFSDKYSYP